MMIDKNKMNKHIENNRGVRDFFGEQTVKNFPGSTYDSKTGIVDYENSPKLKSILDPDNTLALHQITMNIMI